MKIENVLRGFIALFLISISTNGCRPETGSIRVKPGHDDTVQSRDVTSFNRIDIDGNFTVYLENSETCSVTVEGDEEILNVLMTEVEDGTLKIGYVNEHYEEMNQSVIVKIRVVDLKEIKGQKSLKVVTTDIFQFNELILDFAGAVNMDLELSGKSLSGVFAGASFITLNGKVNSLKFEMAGAGKLKAFGLDAKDVDLDLAGARKTEVSVSEKLRVNMAGACYVTYKGNPSNVFSNISGIGRVKKVD